MGTPFEHQYIVSDNIGVAPVGSLVWYMGKLSNARKAELLEQGWMVADGARLNAADYPDLADVMGIAGGTSTFNLPNLTNKYICGVPNTSSPNTGTTYTSQLPNITGSFVALIRGETPEMSGAFSWSDHKKFENGDGYNSWFRTVDFDASKSSPVYTNSTTADVRVPSVTAVPLIRVF